MPIPAIPVCTTPFLETLINIIFKPLSDREALSLHAEILAIQGRWGISYKDAAHRLYQAKMAQLEAEEYALQAIENIRERMDNTIMEDIYPAISHIDNL